MAPQSSQKLPREFFERPTIQVAKDLLGKYVVYHHPRGKLSARIVEVEAYSWNNDPACHAARGMTKRNSIMFGPGGYSYIYFIYGMYSCLNFVTESETKAAAVLLRAAEPDEGLEIMRLNAPGKKVHELLQGPGRFCLSFGLTKKQSGLDLTKNRLYLENREKKKIKIEQTTRVGIQVGTDKLWRFYDKDSLAVSVFRSVKD